MKKMIEAIINCPDKKISIKGVAGAGKTGLVCGLAEALPNQSFLYLSFGKENTINARGRMPGNVFCSSFHALARKKMGVNTNRFVDRFSLSEVSSIFSTLNDPVKNAKMLECISILNDLFCLSGTQMHRVHDVFEKNEALFPSVNKEEKEEMLVRFKSMWSEIWKPGSSLPVTHDMYLKEYSLKAGILHDLDYLIVDEAQDLNDAMFSVVSMLSSANHEMKIIQLGDPSQQIFSFRGASGQFLMERFHFCINKSWRFGKDLADITNQFMTAQALPYYTPIEGSKTPTRVSFPGTFKQLVNEVKSGKKITVIARYNMTLWYMLKNLSLAGVKCSIKGSEREDLAFLIELHQLFLGNPTRSNRLKGISYKRFKKNAQAFQDNQSLLACRFVESVGNSAGELFSTIKKHLVPISQANVLLTTVHQAKGLEFNHVVMMDDFDKCWDIKRSRFQKIKREESHIIYTALTRAKKSIILPKSWKPAA